MFKVKKRREDGKLAQATKNSRANCHPEKIVWARGMCKNCYDKWLKKTNPTYADNQKKNVDKWLSKHPGWGSRRIRQRKQENPELFKRYSRIRILKRYGMTIDDYDSMLKKQNGVCAICGGKPKNGKNLHVDHDHNTGYVRGLLCFRCNFGLSYFDCDGTRIEKLYRYLTKKG